MRTDYGDTMTLFHKSFRQVPIRFPSGNQFGVKEWGDKDNLLLPIGHARVLCVSAENCVSGRLVLFRRKVNRRSRRLTADCSTGFDTACELFWNRYITISFALRALESRMHPR
jgi:hypothetical protein